MMPLSACTGRQTVKLIAHPISKKLKMLLSSFPTAAIPSVSGTLALISVAKEESRSCAGFCFSFDNSGLALIVEVMKNTL
ncbi:hypothetical protein D3C72_1877730 [compost metagenome]